MLTASDIQKKEFEKSFRGYREIEVDNFLDEIKSDYEMMTRENSELKNRINMLNDKINYYSTIEDTLQKTLVVAQSTAEEVIITARKNSDMMLDDSEKQSNNLLREAESKSLKIIEEAEERSEKIIESAQMNTEKMIDSARNQVIESREEYENIRREIQLFKTKYKSMLNSQFEMLEYYSEKGNAFDVEDNLDNREAIDSSNRNLQWTGNISKDELEKEKNLHLDK